MARELSDVYTAQDTGPLTIKRIETVDDRREPHEMVFISDILNVIERLNKLSGQLVETKLARSRRINRAWFPKR
jgi:hypothetical protein